MPPCQRQCPHITLTAPPPTILHPPLDEAKLCFHGFAIQFVEARGVDFSQQRAAEIAEDGGEKLRQSRKSLEPR